MIPVWKRYLARLDSKRPIFKTKAAQNEYSSDVSSYSSRPTLESRGKSAVSDHTSVTSHSKSVSFAEPVVEDQVYSSTVLSDSDSILGSEIAFEMGEYPTDEEVNQVLVSQEYKAANLQDFVEKNCNNLSFQEKGAVLECLRLHENLFQGKRGK